MSNENLYHDWEMAVSLFEEERAASLAGRIFLIWQRDRSSIKWTEYEEKTFFMYFKNKNCTSELRGHVLHNCLNRKDKVVITEITEEEYRGY